MPELALPPIRRLILTRDTDEGVTITVRGVRVRVFLAEVKNMRRVRLGFEAPDEVEIWRDELQDGIDRDGGPTP